jgi:transcription elongation factor Elf1
MEETASPDSYAWLNLTSNSPPNPANSLPYMLIPVQTRVEASSLPPHDENVDYYEEYSKLYMQAVSLTTQVQSLMSEKAELNTRLSSIVKDTKASRESILSNKRLRRKAAQIERHFKCSYCSKSYGAEGSLNQHVRLKHTQQE